MSDVYEVLRASHYTLLTKEEWDLATSENFNLNLPMTVRRPAADAALGAASNVVFHHMDVYGALWVFTLTAPCAWQHRLEQKPSG